MATITKKQKEALALYPNLKGKKREEIYKELKLKGYEWDSYNLKWVDKDSKESDLALIDMNFSASNDLIDDVLEIIQEALTDYGFKIEKSGRPQPAQVKDKKGNFVKSEERSKVYLQLSLDESENEETDEDETEE